MSPPKRTYNSHRSIASRFLSLGSDLSATIRLGTTVPLFPPNRVSVAFVYTSSLFVPRKSSVGRARLTRTNWQNSAKHTPPRNDPFFPPFFLSFFLSLDDRLATIRANALPAVRCVLYTLRLCVVYVHSRAPFRFYRTPRCSTVRERMSSGIDGRQAGSYRLSPAPRDSIRMVAALLPARQHH